MIHGCALSFEGQHAKPIFEGSQIVNCRVVNTWVVIFTLYKEKEF